MWKDLIKVDTGPINHIKKNIELSYKINKIRDIQLFCKSIVKDNDIKDIKKFKSESDMIQRYISAKQLNKWNDFKSKKYIAIEDFTNRRKRIFKVK